MRRRAVLVVEYDKESGKPLTSEQWERALSDSYFVNKVLLESDD